MWFSVFWVLLIYHLVLLCNSRKLSTILDLKKSELNINIFNLIITYHPSVKIYMILHQPWFPALKYESQLIASYNCRQWMPRLDFCVVSQEVMFQTIVVWKFLHWSRVVPFSHKNTNVLYWQQKRQKNLYWCISIAILSVYTTLLFILLLLVLPSYFSITFWLLLGDNE